MLKKCYAILVIISSALSSSSQVNDEEYLMELALNCRIENEIAKLYPNPTDGYLYYDQDSKNNTPLSYEIFDMLGRKHMSGISSSGMIDVGQLGSGMYIVKVTKNRHVLTKKIVRN